MVMHVNEAIDRFVDHCRIAKRLSPHTLRAYATDLSEFSAFLGDGRSVDLVDRGVLRGFARHLFDIRSLKETTVRRRMAALKVMFRWLEQEEVVALSPFHRLNMSIKLPRTLPRALSADEIRRLLRRAEFEAMNSGGPMLHGALLMHFVVVCLFTTGLRVGELAGVAMADIDLHTATILVRGKGNRERRVFLPNREAVSLLRRYLTARAKIAGKSDALLVTEAGSVMTTQHVRRRLQSLAKRAGLKRRITPHMLRHTAATQLIEAGVDIRFVQKLLGHASIATTQIYTQVSDGSLKAIMEKADTLGRVVGGAHRRGKGGR